MPDQENAHMDNLQRSLGRRIRELRSKHGWTQEQFAEFCGVHRTYLGHVERGEKNVSLSTVSRLATALGVRIPALFGSASNLRHVRPRLAKPARPEVDHLLDELQAQRKALRQALRDLTGCLGRLTDLAS